MYALRKEIRRLEDAAFKAELYVHRTIKDYRAMIYDQTMRIKVLEASAGEEMTTLVLRTLEYARLLKIKDVEMETLANENAELRDALNEASQRADNCEENCAAESAAVDWMKRTIEDLRTQLASNMVLARPSPVPAGSPHATPPSAFVNRLNARAVIESPLSVSSVVSALFESPAAGGGAGGGAGAVLPPAPLRRSSRHATPPSAFLSRLNAVADVPDRSTSLELENALAEEERVLMTWPGLTGSTVEHAEAIVRGTFPKLCRIEVIPVREMETLGFHATVPYVVRIYHGLDSIVLIVEECAVVGV